MLAEASDVGCNGGEGSGDRSGVEDVMGAQSADVR